MVAYDTVLASITLNRIAEVERVVGIVPPDLIVPRWRGWWASFRGWLAWVHAWLNTPPGQVAERAPITEEIPVVEADTARMNLGEEIDADHRALTVREAQTVERTVNGFTFRVREEAK